MTVAELDAFPPKVGARPTELAVAVDALAVFVNKDNPLTALTLSEVDAIFSSTRKRGGSPVRTWADVGLTGEWAARPITLYGYGPAAGAHAMFREVALSGGEFKPALKVQPGSSSVVQGPAADPGGIAYASIFFRTWRTRPVPLSGGDGAAVLPTQDAAVEGRYPLARFLYLYVLLETAPPPPRAVIEFLRFVSSRDGQAIVARDGNYSADGGDGRRQPPRARPVALPEIRPAAARAPATRRSCPCGWCSAARAPGTPRRRTPRGSCGSCRSTPASSGRCGSTDVPPAAGRPG
jgi:phosphate transport system substrate-binding protein